MSLTSRLANLFSSGASTPQPPEIGHQNTLALSDDGKSVAQPLVARFELEGPGPESDTMSPQAIEEEERPPYLHVSIAWTSGEEDVC